MKKLLIGFASVITAIVIFTSGVYASQWLNFTGDDEIEQADSDIDEIMEILRNVHAGKQSAEEALAELESLNPKGLVEKIKRLEEEKAGLQAQIDSDGEYVDHLEKELTRANESVSGHGDKTNAAVEEARTYQDGGE